MSFDRIVSDDDNTKWYFSRDLGLLDVASTSRCLDVAEDFHAGLWFCETAQGKKQTRTSRLFEFNPYPKRVSELASWPMSTRPVAPSPLKLLKGVSPSELAKNTEKRELFLNATVSQSVPAAIFLKGFDFVENKDPFAEKRTNSYAYDLGRALLKNTVEEQFCVFRKFIKAAGFSSLTIQRQFPVIPICKDADYNFDHSAADLVIFCTIDGVPVPLFWQEQESKPGDVDQGFAQGVGYYSYYHETVEVQQSEHSFLKFHPCFLMSNTSDNVGVYGLVRIEGGEIAVSDLYRSKLGNLDKAKKVGAIILKGLYSGLKKLEELVKEWQGEDLFPVVETCTDSVYINSYTKVLSNKAYEALALVNETKRVIPVVVKFIKGPSYSRDIQNQCARDEGCAPKVFAMNNTRLYTMVVMEKVEGVTLNKFLEEKEQHHPDHVAKVCSNVEKALEYLHKKGFAHGDFREWNILITDDGLVKIVDFDWVCEESVDAVYPVHLNDTVRWPCSKNDKIEKMHDLYFLAGLKMLLKGKNK
ncbi:uncharacterized protein [Oscarella lobularis]